MPNGEPTDLWGKIRRDDPSDQASAITGWHPLADHCADVAACFEGLLRLRGYRARAEALLRSELCDVRLSRLSLLAFLHDIGKGNAGFQSKVFPPAVRHPSAPRGHLAEAAQLLTDLRLRRLAIPMLRLEDIEDWFSEDRGHDLGGVRMLIAAWSHHGVPLAQGINELENPMPSGAWESWRWSSPEATLGLFSQEIQAHYAAAFLPASQMLVTPRFQAFFAGLLMLSDWLGSSEMWPFSEPGDGPRLPWAREHAKVLINSMGLDADVGRDTLRSRPHTYSDLFGISTPNAMQRVVASLPLLGISK